MFRHSGLIIIGILLAVVMLLGPGLYAAKKATNETDALIFACLQGNVKEVKRLIDKGINVNSKGPSGITPLISATRSKHKEIVKLLLENGANVNAQDDKGWTALMRVSGKSPEVVELLVKAGADVNLGNNKGWKPLFRMLAGLKATQILVKKGADVNARNPSGSTVLMWASCIASPEVVQFLLENGADVNAKNPNGQTALADAVATTYTPKRLEVSKLLIKHGADINAQDANGLTPLMKALSAGHQEIVEFLREKGAKGTPANLYQAIYVNDVDSAKSFIKKGHDVNKINKDGATPLILACSHGHVQLVQLLLKSGAKVNATDTTGRTPLMYACNNRVALAHTLKRVLTGTGAKQSSEFPDIGRRMAKLLIDHNANINAQGVDGITALMIASHAGDGHLVKLLVEKGANVQAKDKNGYTAIEYAGRNQGIRQLLLEQVKSRKE
jgi:ankyrin repeat protein